MRPSGSIYASFSGVLVLQIVNCGPVTVSNRSTAGLETRSSNPDQISNSAGSKETNTPLSNSDEADESELTPLAENTLTLAAEKIAIEFDGVQGDRVPGYLWLPSRAPGQKLPAVLAMYGLTDDKDSPTIAAAAEELSKQGLAALTIDWPGTGERGSYSSLQRITDKKILIQTVGDYGKAIDFLMSREDVDSSRVAYVGASMGAMTGIKFVAEDSRIKAFVPIVPIPNPLWGEDQPSTKIKQISAKTLCICSTQDSSCTVCELSIGETREYQTGHELEDVQDEVIGDISTFLKENL